MIGIVKSYIIQNNLITFDFEYNIKIVTQKYDIYDIVYDDYDESTKNVYTKNYQGGVSICNKTIDLPSLSLRTLQSQLIPYWFKYMVAL